MSFSRILGQERAIEILKRLFASNRFPQGLLFYGPSGVGKRAVALELAKVLNCQTRIHPLPRLEMEFLTGRGNSGTVGVITEQYRNGALTLEIFNGVNADMDADSRGKNYQRASASDFKQLAEISVIDACDNCLSCQKIDKGIHPDVRIISPEKDTLGIDRIRELNRDSQWKPFEGRYKVYILEKAEKLNQEAANSFLKTLEEPPPRVLFVLLSENKDTLLPTILSRCWVLPFSGLSGKVIGEILQHSIFNYPREILPSEYFFAGRIQEVIFSEDFLLFYKKIEKFWQNMFSFTEVEMLNLSEEYSKDKEETGKFLTLLLLFARSKKYWKAVEFINQIKNQIQRNLNRQLVLDCLLLKLKSLCR